MSYIFIDESGIHQKNGKSSVVLVYVSVENLELLEKEIISIEQDLKMDYFHWANTAWQYRELFLRRIMKSDFSLKIALVQNPFSPNYYEKVIKHLVGEEAIVSIIIDGNMPHNYERRFKKVLRDRGIKTNKLIFGNDKSYPILRLADACAGLTRYYYDNPDHAKAMNLYKTLLVKIEILFIM